MDTDFRFGLHDSCFAINEKQTIDWAVTIFNLFDMLLQRAAEHVTQKLQRSCPRWLVIQERKGPSFQYCLDEFAYMKSYVIET